MTHPMTAGKPVVPGDSIERCPDRIVHEKTKTAMCKHPDNRPLYFCGFQYCDWRVTGKWGHKCVRGYAR